MHDDVLRTLGETAGSVELRVPPSSEYLRTVRLVAADAGSRAGLDCEEIEDFRIAVDELCHLIMGATDHFVTITLAAFDDRVVARGSAPKRPGDASRQPAGLSAMILSSAADYYDVENGDDAMTFTVVKQARRVLAEQP